MDIQFIGNYREQNQGFVGSVYGWGGCCPSIRARDYKEPILILVEVNDGDKRAIRNDKKIWKQK